MTIQNFISLDQITVSGTFDQPFYPVYVNEWSQVAIDKSNGLGASGWLLMGGTASGPILASYVEDGNIYNLARKSFVDSMYESKITELSQYLPLKGGILDSPLFLAVEPTEGSNAATVGYMNNLSSSYLKTESDDNNIQKMTGPITLHSTLDSAYDTLNAVPRKYVENKITVALAEATLQLKDYVKLSGSTATGHIEVNDPVNDNDACNLGYVKSYLSQKTIEFFKA
jgi:hypothetical protein